MLLENAIYNRLKADAAVVALVAGRIFGGVINQEVTTWPCLVYAAEGRKRVIETLEGGCALVEQHIKITSGGKTYGQAAELDSAAELALDGFRGQVSTSAASPPQTITFQRIFITLPSHEYEYDDTTKTHNFNTVFACYFIDPRRLT